MPPGSAERDEQEEHAERDLAGARSEVEQLGNADDEEAPDERREQPPVAAEPDRDEHQEALGERELARPDQPVGLGLEHAGPRAERRRDDERGELHPRRRHPDVRREVLVLADRSGGARRVGNGR